MMLLSRVADSLYWGARYLERAEDTARVIRSYTDLVIDMPTTVVSSWEPLLAVAGDRPTFDAQPAGASGAARVDSEQNIVRFLVADATNPGSVASSIATARENLRTTREVLPRDVWQAVNDLSLYTLANVASGVDRRNRARFLNRVIAECQRIDGAMSTLMSRDHAFDLWQLGRSIERADMTARVVGVRAASLIENRSDDTGSHTSEIYDDVQWMGLLRSVNALQMYQRTIRGPVDAAKAVDFLLLDPAFPRSVKACVGAIRVALDALPRAELTRPAVDELDALLADVSVAGGVPNRGVADRGMPDRGVTDRRDGAALDEAMDRVLLGLAAVHAAVDAALFRAEA
jgi:uncharacterized alpha-E superfamily protein